ncbi:hypothetical protein [Tomitella cavernea]|uniref:DUF2530 domain-containing protein n=1 Tax=Tomitella cavernea TaxID=1387982 RepID=A0ABP9CCD7_9ACTN|nr:hypothetical protein [Tomitella cavernea]
MADNTFHAEPGGPADVHPDAASDVAAGHGDRRGPSGPMLCAALAAFAVAVWALFGPFSLAFLGAVDLRWAFVIAAGVVGLLLTAGPRLRPRRRRHGGTTGR